MQQERVRPCEQAEMRELKVMTLGRQLSLVHSSKNSSASFQSPAFSHALIRLLYVITLRSQPCTTAQIRTTAGLCHYLPWWVDSRCKALSTWVAEGCH